MNIATFAASNNNLNIKQMKTILKTLGSVLLVCLLFTLIYIAVLGICILLDKYVWHHAGLVFCGIGSILSVAFLVWLKVRSAKKMQAASEEKEDRPGIIMKYEDDDPVLLGYIADMCKLTISTGTYLVRTPYDVLKTIISHVISEEPLREPDEREAYMLGELRALGKSFIGLIDDEVSESEEHACEQFLGMFIYFRSLHKRLSDAGILTWPAALPEEDDED